LLYYYWRRLVDALHLLNKQMDSCFGVRETRVCVRKGFLFKARACGCASDCLTTTGDASPYQKVNGFIRCVREGRICVRAKRVYVHRIQFSRAELVVVRLIAAYHGQRLVDALELIGLKVLCAPK